MWVISNTFVGAAVALGFSHYLAVLIPGLLIQPVAIAIIIAFAILNIMGAKSSANFNNILVVVKILILFFFIGLGSLHIDFIPASRCQPGYWQRSSFSSGYHWWANCHCQRAANYDPGSITNELRYGSEPRPSRAIGENKPEIGYPISGDNK